MTATTETCWADPLSRTERAALAPKLARACKRAWDASDTRRFAFRADATALSRTLIEISAEMSDLHLDVTERAEWPPLSEEQDQ